MSKPYFSQMARTFSSAARISSFPGSSSPRTMFSAAVNTSTSL